MNLMLPDNMRRFIITRAPEHFDNLVYEVVSDDGKFVLKVEWMSEQQDLIKKQEIRFFQTGFLAFKTTNTSLQAKLHFQTAQIDFFLPNGEPRGRVREAAWSLAGKTVVEDEHSHVLGWIKFGFKKDRILLSNGHEAGLVIRSPHKNLPWFLFSSKAHLIKRFELFSEPTEFDERLLFAWICRNVLEENSSSG